MKAPPWWWDVEPTPTARLLAPLGFAYGALTGARMARPGSRAGAPVVCVGNFVAGGAGKTPTAIALAHLLIAMRARPAFLSRGYGRRAFGARAAVLRVDRRRHGADEAGDEPLLLAAVAPTFVSADRRAAAAAATAAGADVLIMDDGLQNPSLVKDWSLAVVDGATGIGNGLCLPAGPLRAMMARQWPAVSAVCIIGEGAPGERVAELARAAGKASFSAGLEPDPVATASLRGMRLLAFAGIGRPSKFTDTLRGAGLDVVAARAYADHQRLGAAELSYLVAEARRLDAQLVTTEKDRVRLPADFAAHVVPVTLTFGEDRSIVAAVADAIRIKPAG